MLNEFILSNFSFGFPRISLESLDTGSALVTSFQTTARCLNHHSPAIFMCIPVFFRKRKTNEKAEEKNTHNRRLSLSVAFFIHMKNVAIRMVQLHLPPSTKSLHFIYRYTSFDSVVDAVVLMYPNWILTLGTRITQYTHTSCNLAANSPLILFSFIYILLIYIKCSLFSYFTFGFFWELLRTLDATSKNPTRILRILPNARSKHFFHSQKYCLFGNRIFFANWANVNISHLCIKILASTHTVISILSTQ